MYKVLDICGGTLKEFSTFEETNKFGLIANRLDWTIKKL